MRITFLAQSATAACLLAAASVPAAYAQPAPNQPDSVLFNPRNTTDSQIVAPTAPNWRIPQNPVRKFDKFILPAPPSNTSAQTRAELDELNQLAATRNNQNVIDTINRWNFDPPASNYNYYFDHLVQAEVYSPPLAARCSAMLNEGTYAALLSTWYNKFIYLRPRPDQVTGYTFVAAAPSLPTPAHPAYPAGHSAVAGVFMAVGPACFPEQPVEDFVALGRESSLARRQGGVHYYSDSVAGEALGYSIGSAVVRAYRNDGSPLGGNTAPSVYSRSSGTPTTTLRVKRPTITVGPQLASDQANPNQQRIILVPFTPFQAPPAVQNPAAAISIPAISTTDLDFPEPTPVNPNGTTNNAPRIFSDPDPAPNTGNVNNDAPLAPLDQVDSAPTTK